MVKFLRLTENNDWEGETWHFYLQLDGNEELLEKLRIEISRIFDEEKCEPVPFVMDDQVFDEDLVDEFLKIRGRSTYLSDHNKVVGKFNFDFNEIEKVKDKTPEWEWQRYEDALYKGGIKDYFKK